MRARLTAGNRLTLPRAALAAVGPADYFDVITENGRIVLTPVRVNRADAVRMKVEGLGLSEADLGDAVEWARSGA
ncbi:MAG: AbrB/MazE/SpoVT family DNA-binding domain-containing protein [Rhodospirillaceae bacterium]|nr:AbrB/MazE/SpoVT family DNA-binding domain-containing protein [Rhodospirillaceae bacterium]